jgi:Tol biopolymer transport system component
MSSPLYNLEVVDRLGKIVIQDSIPMKTYEKIGHGWSNLNISPRGNLIAVTGRTYGSTDIWLLNLNNKTSEKITFESSEDEYPVWSPDGKLIAYTSAMVGTERKILIQDLETRGNPRLLRKWPRHIHITDWSSNGEWLMAYDYSSNNSTDCYAISVNSDEVIPVATSQAEESSGLFSPDGKWLTYRSVQSGKAEIYIVAFPEIENKRQLFTGSERDYRWDRSGKFIYFRDGDYLYAQEIDISNEVIKAKPVKLFQTQFIEFDVSSDGQKFYLRKSNITRPNTPLCLITNWFQELETKTDK